MSKIKEYKLISSIGILEFELAVNDHIKNGWIPIGGVSSFFITMPKDDGSGVHLGMEYSQAMVLHDDVIRINNG